MERGLTDDVSNNMATCHVEEMLGGKSRRLSAFQQAYEKEEKFEQKLDVAKVTPIRAEPLTEAQWRFAMCEDEMASYKLDEGIRAFVKDTLTLKETLRQMRTETGKIWPQD